ncbi:MAG: type VII secretion-associated serine protease mycosin, partial [Pseudonocardia sp.]|nr:type VII secretion-associated serine protease mycosin [Pseudonocardia sp.]
MNRFAVGLLTAGCAVFPALASAPADTGMPGASTPPTTVSASLPVMTGTGGSAHRATPTSEARTQPEEAPVPPPPDMSQLPASERPVARPGVRQRYSCVSGGHFPDTAEMGDRLWGQRLFRLPELRTLTTGRSVRIAVIDTGVARNPRLAGRLIAGGDFVAGGDGLTDCDGHGTLVAGIAAASVDAGTGFAGVAPAAEVISIRQSSPSYVVADPTGTEVQAGDLQTLAMAVLHAVDLGADVINISEASCAPPGVAGAAELRAAIHRAVQRDVVIIAAAGNLGGGRAGECPETPTPGTVVYPAWFADDVLAVASVGPGEVPSGFNYPGPWVRVAAPGERLVSLAVEGAGLTDQLPGGNARTPIDGTSFAAPSVAGLAALIRARYPRLTAGQVIDRITATASQHASGRTDTTGYGLVDPVAAVTRGPAVLPPPG